MDGATTRELEARIIRPTMNPNVGVTKIDVRKIVPEILNATDAAMNPADNQWKQMPLYVNHAGCDCVPRARRSTIVEEECLVLSNDVVHLMAVMTIVREDEVGTRGRNLRLPSNTRAIAAGRSVTEW